MTVSAVLTAAQQFAKDEEGRKRKRLTPEETAELDQAIAVFSRLRANTAARLEPLESAHRGNVIVHMFGYDDKFENAAEDVITDILWALQARGLDPEAALESSRTFFQQERERSA